MTPLQVLEQAYELIVSEEHWCQHAEMIGYKQYCSTGAIWRIAKHTPSASYARTVLGTYVPSVYAGHRVVLYNDKHKHWQVMRLWRLAIASEKAGGKEARAQARRIRQQVIAMREQAKGARSIELSHV